MCSRRASDGLAPPGGARLPEQRSRSTLCFVQGKSERYFDLIMINSPTYTILIRLSSTQPHCFVRHKTSTRSEDKGMGMAWDHKNSGSERRASPSCDLPIRRARVPSLVSRRAATGRTLWKRSTARRVTRLAVPGVWSSAREANTSMSVNVSARITSRKKTTFFWFDSIKVTGKEGDQTLMGMPGKPAPDPTSMRWPGEALDGKGPRLGPANGANLAHPGSPIAVRDKCRAAKSDSPKWRVAISSGVRMAVKLMRAFQRSSRSMYVDICSSCFGL